jgi:hypothetical protein
VIGRARAVLPVALVGDEEDVAARPAVRVAQDQGARAGGVADLLAADPGDVARLDHRVPGHGSRASAAGGRSAGACAGSPPGTDEANTREDDGSDAHAKAFGSKGSGGARRRELGSGCPNLAGSGAGGQNP